MIGDVTTPANNWFRQPLPVDGNRVRARVKFGLVSSYVFLSWLFPKNCYLTQVSFKIDRKGTIVSLTALVFTGDDEVCLQRFQWIPGLSHWRSFCFSVWWFDNLHFNSCSLKCLKSALFGMNYIEVNKQCCQKFEAELKIICMEFRIFVISSTNDITK